MKGRVGPCRCVGLACEMPVTCCSAAGAAHRRRQLPVGPFVHIARDHFGSSVPVLCCAMLYLQRTCSCRSYLELICSTKIASGSAPQSTPRIHGGCCCAQVDRSMPQRPHDTAGHGTLQQATTGSASHMYSPTQTRATSLECELAHRT